MKNLVLACFLGVFLSGGPGLRADVESLFPAGQDEVTFKVLDGNGQVPRTSFLKEGRTQTSIADYVKGKMRDRETDENRKNLVSKNPGLEVVVVGIAFRKTGEDEVEARIIGDLRERVISQRFSLQDIEKNREIALRMGPSAKTIDLGFYLTAETTAETNIRFSWDSRTDELKVVHAKGNVKVALGWSTTESQFEFKDLVGKRGEVPRQPIETEF